MTPPGTARLSVDADLHLDVDGVRADITGQGDRLLVTTDHPLRLARAVATLGRTAGSARARSVLSRLGDEGLSVTIAGRHGELVHVTGPRRIRIARSVLGRGAAAVLVATATATAVVRLNRRRGGR